MRIAIFITGLLAISAATVCAQTKSLDFELLTWPELKQAIANGKTTALIFNGGVEQRGPQGVSGAHNFVAHALALEIAEKLGNAIVAPTIPFSVNNGASTDLPGTIGISASLFASLNEEEAEQLIRNGFRNVVLMGDHGGGQKELAAVATKLDAKHSAQGVRVVYCSDVYVKAGADFDQWLKAHDLPVGSHASIKDTSELWYLGGDKGWIRQDQIATAVSDASHKNGISGDARKSSPEIGKVISDMKVNCAVAQIRQLLGSATVAAQ
jgi:creatinine amidohydrolase/Fe(II)-dependent formamide hydrolase-like protein